MEISLLTIYLELSSIELLDGTELRLNHGHLLCIPKLNTKSTTSILLEAGELDSEFLNLKH